MITPVGDNVLLEIITQLSAEAEELKKRSGILLADSTRQGEPDRGRVFAISPDIEDPEYQIGDLVVFHTKEIFQGFKLEGKDLIAVKDDEIIAKILEEK